MKELFLSFELSKLLREKGFDEDCLAFFYEDTNTIAGCKDESQYRLTGFATYKNSEGLAVSAPTYDQCLAWIREEHGLYLGVKVGFGDETWYAPYIISLENYWEYGTYSTYEEAREAAITKALDLI